MVDSNNLEEEMRRYGLQLPDDMEFIKDLIKGEPFKGRPDKPFLYEIVANKRNGIDVDKFDYLARDAYHLGIKSSFDHRRFIKFARVWKVDGRKQICTRDKVFNDPIHGTVELHPLLVKMIDTPQFQRLRYIKQLGGVYFVYPGASHNRFEHSIGVAHLAGELAKALQTRQPELNIDDRDVLCVQIAGLCHDLVILLLDLHTRWERDVRGLAQGHFGSTQEMNWHLSNYQTWAFFPSFETFIRQARPEINWKHEVASVRLFDYMVKSNKLKEDMELYGLQLPDDVEFIKELIKGETREARPDKPFLYEIVANKRNGIDVDKFDYLARDAYHLGIKSSFDHRRFINFARVCEVDGQLQICTRDKEVNNMSDLFHLRYSLHSRAYQHKVNNIIEHMITEAFLKADEHIQIEGSRGQMFTLSTAIDDMKAYTKLTDHVYETILHSSQPVLADAKRILRKIVDRNHYRFLVETSPTPSIEDMIAQWQRDNNIPDGMTPEEAMKRGWEQELAEARDGQDDDQDFRLTAEDFKVDIVKMDYGMKNENPIDQVRFYRKDHPKLYRKRKPEKGFRLPMDQRSMSQPQCFSEQLIRIYCKRTDESSVNAARRHAVKWCRAKGWPILNNPQGNPQ